MNTILPNILSKVAIGLTLLLLVSINSASYAETYKTNEAFLKEAFAGKVPAPKHIWLRDGLKKQVNDILMHPYGKLRVKYWMSANKSVWILEEVGKEKPITTGIIINKQGKVSKVEILAFRESRGWEIKYPFFLKQFINADLKTNQQLDKNVDGITGATLSVRAVTKLARMALLLHHHQKKIGK
ncbi:MAG: FMN-binding protein [Thiotrichaceae bacterium]